MSSSMPYKSVRLEGIDVTSDVSSVTVEDHDRLTDRATVVLSDPSESVAEVPREGQSVLVDLGWSGDNSHGVLFEGVITRVQVRASGSASQTVTLTAFDLSHRLKRRPERANHVSSVNHTGTLSSIMSNIVTRDSAVGIQIGQVEPDPDPEFTEQLPLRQTSQTDWDFIIEQARRYNCRAFVEYNENASKFYFIPISRILQGDPMGSLTYNGSTGQITDIHFERNASLASTAASSSITDPLSGETVSSGDAPRATETPSSPSASTLARDRRIDRALQVTAEAAGQPEDQRPQRLVAGLPSDPVRAQAETTQDPSFQLGLRAIGQCVGTIMLRAKGRVNLYGVASWAEGPWYVRQVSHTVVTSGGGSGQPGYRCRFLLTR